MKEIQYKGLSLFLRISLEVVFYLGLISTISLPYILHRYPVVLYRYFWFYLANDANKLRISILFVFLFGVSALVAVRQLILIFKSVNNDNPFVKENVDRLRNISICCFVVFGTFTLKCISYFTLLTFLFASAFFIAGLSALVFSRLFRQAVEYKSENDLTI